MYVAHAQVSQIPQAETGTAEDITSTSVILRGSVVANAIPASVWVEHGKTPALGNRTDVPAPQDSVTRYEVRVSLSGIPGGSSYYYRVIAENQFGRREGSIVNFAIPAISAGAVSESEGASVSENGSALTSQCVSLLPNLSNSQFAPGGRMNYSFVYRNECGSEIKNASIKIILPSSVEFVGTDYLDFIRDGRTVIYTLGSVAPHFQSAIVIEANISKDAREGEPVIFEGSFSFRDSAGVVHSAGARTEELVHVPSPTLAAITLPALRVAFEKPLVWLLVLFIISFAVYYRFFIRRRGARATKSRALIPFVEPSHQ